MTVVPATDGVLLGPWLEMRLALWPECPPDQSLAEIRSQFDRPDQAAFIALDAAGAALGFVEVAVRDRVEGSAATPVGYLEGIYVRPGQRRRGVARALVEVATQWAGDRGCRVMGSDTAPDNLASIALHRSLGFAEADRLVVFVKPLDDPAGRA